MCRVRSFAERTPVDIFRFRCEILSAVRAKDRLAQMVGQARGDIPKLLDLVPPSLEKAGVKKNTRTPLPKKKGKSTAGRKDGASLFQTIELNISQF